MWSEGDVLACSVFRVLGSRELGSLSPEPLAASLVCQLLGASSLAFVPGPGMPLTQSAASGRSWGAAGGYEPPLQERLEEPRGRERAFIQVKNRKQAAQGYPAVPGRDGIVSVLGQASNGPQALQL